MIRPSATIQVTIMEFVTGKPKGRAISTAFCDKPCSAAALRLRFRREHQAGARRHKGGNQEEPYPSRRHTGVDHRGCLHSGLRLNRASPGYACKFVKRTFDQELYK